MVQLNHTCLSSVDDSFGPWAGQYCRHGFDFTLLFEESILTIPLLSLFLAAVPIRVVQLIWDDTKVLPSLQHWFKAAASICLLSLNAALLCYFTTTPIIQTRTTIATAALSLTTSLGFCLLSWLEHRRTIRPSFLLSIFLFLSIILDIARARTLWMLPSGRVIPVLFTSSVALRVVMLVLESSEKRRILAPRYKDCSRETTSSTVSRSAFWWLMPLFLNGYGNLLTLDNLYPLDENLRSKRLYEKLDEAWGKVCNKAAAGTLCFTWFRVFWSPVLAAVIPKLLQAGFVYSQPFLITAAINLASQPQTQPYQNTGYGLIAAYVIVYTGVAISTGQFEWRVYRAATIMRGSVASLIYKKSLRLAITSQSVSPDGALTLISTDCETIAEGILFVHLLWGGIMEVAIGLYLTYREMGVACAIPFCVVFVCTIGIGFAAIPMGTAHATWVQASQDRVTLTSQALGNIKWLKISGLNEVIFNMIRNLRTRELAMSERYRMMILTCLVIVICVPIWVPIFTFCTFAGLAARGNTTLTISKAFTSYSILVLVTKPLSEIIVALPMIATLFTSFQRIQNFLNGEERNDNRLSESGKDDGDMVTEIPSPKPASTFLSSDEGFELARGKGSVAIAAEQTQDLIVSVSGQFSWPDASKPVINIRDWKIRRGTFTLLLGPVGCGKSTLLKTILGELSSFEGTIRTNYSGVSYCSQTPWLPNETIRKVIVGSSDLDESWYQKVINACALDTDISNWPNGDKTVVGTRGISISGGQKQRLSVARALYSRKEFMLFDDILSGLDSTTEDAIFQNLFGRQGMLRAGNMTTVIASSNVRWASSCDQIMILDKNSQVIAQGKPKDLERHLGLYEASGEWRPAAKIGEGSVRATGDNCRLVELETTTAMTLQEASDRRLGDSATLKFYVTSIGWVSSVILVGSMAIFAFSNSFPNIWLKWWAELNEIQPNQELGKWLGVYIALGVGSLGAIFVGARQVFITIINNSGVYYHGLLVKTTSEAPLSFHSTVDSGITVNRFSQDLQLIDMELPSHAIGVAAGLSSCVASLILISISSKYLAILLPFIGLALYGLQHFYLRTSRQMRLLDIEYKAPLYTQLIKTLDGLVTIRAFQWEDFLEQQNIEILDDSQRPSYLLYCVQRWLTFALDIMIMFIAFVLIVIITTFREQIGPGYAGIALINILSLSGAMKSTLSSFVDLEVALGAVCRIRKFATETKAEAHPGQLQTGLVSKDWPTKGAIAFHDLTASYISSGPILNHISFSIEPGQKIAVCGRTGSGKSSLVLCLLRLLEPDTGDIVIDGVKLSTVPHELVRTRLVALPQEAFVFSGTIRLNIDPTKIRTDEEIISVLQKVKLWNMIEQRGGLDIPMQEKMFSQGETQLLVFARAMLRKGRVLILDESTSSLDEETSTIVHDLLKSYFKDWTVIAVVHRLNSIFDFDKVAVIDSGKLVEFDGPQTLLERDAAFKTLYDLSTRNRD